jgi:hypothetical protein
MRFLTRRSKLLTLFFDGVMKNLVCSPLRYLRTVWRKRVEPLLNMRDDGLLRREFQPSFAQERLYERFDRPFQEVPRGSGDDEIISIPDQVDFGVFSRFTPFWEVGGQELFQPVQGHRRNDG